MSHQPKHIYEFGSYRLDAAERLLLRAGEPVPLQPKVFDLLRVLVEHQGHLLEKDELMKLVWPDAIVEEANLANNISILRKTLSENGERFIETVPKRGYRFVADVRAVAPDGATAGEERPSALDESGIKPAPTAAAKRPLSRLQGHRLGVGMMLAALITAAAYWAYRMSEGRNPAEPFREMQIRRLTNTGTVFEAAISPDGRVIAYIAGAAAVGGYHSLWLKQLTTNQETQLVPEAGFRYRGLAFSPDGKFIYYSQRRDRGAESALYRISIPGGEPQKLLAGVDSAVSFSPDGSQLAFVRGDEAFKESVLMISNADGTAAQKITASQYVDAYSVDGPSWSPDGKLIAVAKKIFPSIHFRLLTVRVADGVEQQIGDTRWEWLMRVAWLKDGSGLVTAGKIKSGRPNYPIWLVTYPNGELRRITNDLNNYYNLNLTPDTTKLVTVQSEVRSNIWIVSAENPRSAVPITYDPVSQHGYKGLDWTPDGRIVYTSLADGHQNIWVINADGHYPRQITTNTDDDNHFPVVANDGRHIAFTSSRSGQSHIWRIDMDGGNLKELSQGKDDLLPQWSPDGGWIVHSAMNNYKRGIAKMPAHGGSSTPFDLTAKYADFPVVSPDGKLVACLYVEKGTQLGLLPLSGTAKVETLNFPISQLRRNINMRWHPEGRALSYLDARENASNVWLFPLDSGTPSKLTDFQGEQIFAYAWSRDGRYLACARGTINRDVVMISRFR